MENLRHSLDLGITCPVYLFYGEETLLLEEAVRRIAGLVLPPEDQWGRESYYGDDVDIKALVLSAQSAGMFAPKKLILVRNVPWFKRKGKSPTPAETEDGDNKELLEPLLTYLADPNPDTVLILTADKSDKGSRLHKAVVKSGRAVEFTTPQARDKEAWLNAYLNKAGKKAEPGAASYICLMSGEGLSALKTEADKLLLYCGDRDTVALADAEDVVSQGAVAGIFQLTDTAAAQKGGEAVEIYRRLLRQGEAAQFILAMLAAQYRNILGVKDLLERGFTVMEAAGKLGIAPYAARKCSGLCRSYSYRQLMKALEILLNTDIAGKSGGGAVEQLLEVAILRLCAL